MDTEALLAGWRGRNLIVDSTSQAELAAHLDCRPRTFYVGFDPTADSLHVGSLMPLLAARRLQLAGHRPIVLVGGGTGLIGDPSGKAGERTLSDPDRVAACVAALKKQVSRLIDFAGGEGGAVLVDNHEWLGRLDAVTFLRDTGKHFSVSMMLGKDSVRSRIERDGGGISFTEFSYMILQAYDYLMLRRHHGCTLQIGGSDQWGNITAGIDLVRRVMGEKVHGLTLPLVTRSDGLKFGKTEGGTVWLDPVRTSPYEMYQFWLGCSDEDVLKFLAYFTFLPLAAIGEIGRDTLRNPGRRSGQKTLADEVTRLVHGDAGLAEARRITEAFFNGAVEQLSEPELTHAVRGAPHHVRSADQCLKLSDALVLAQLVPSRSRARELINARSVTVNGIVAGDPEGLVRAGDALYGKFSVIRRGRKTFHIIVWSNRVPA